MDDVNRHAIVRVLGQRDQTVGTGFMVTSTGVIATCAHVVKQANSWAGESIWVVVYGHDEPQEATVLQDNAWSPPDEADVAFLCLPPPPLDQPYPVLPLGQVLPMRPQLLTSFGFPEQTQYEGLAATCELIGNTTEHGHLVHQIRSEQISTGFSGAPVWDPSQRCVVGMVVSILSPDEYDRNTTTAFVTPSKTLQTYYPTLRVQPLPWQQRWFYPRYKYRWIIGISALAFVFVVVVIMSLRPQPMPAGGWNIAIADIAWDSGDGIAQSAEQGAALSQRMGPLLTIGIPAECYRHLPAITGDAQQRQEQAAMIAAQTNANVVIYGVLRQTGPERADFLPEIYINPNHRETSIAISEIVGPTQFGAPLPHILGKTRSDEDLALTRRLNALRYFLDGIQSYANDDYAAGVADFEQALCVLGSAAYCGLQDPPEQLTIDEHDDQHAMAVIHLFMAATSVGEATKVASEQTDTVPLDTIMAKTADALRETTTAHTLWPEYARPYLTRSTAWYLRANALVQVEGQVVEAPSTAMAMDCFTTNVPDDGVSGWYLQLALQCADDTLAASGATHEMELATKIAFSRATIFLLYTFYTDRDYWDDVLQLSNTVIAAYEQAEPAQQPRLRRLAARAYARRGLVRYYRPATTPTLQREAYADYQHAIALLVHPTPDFSCAENIALCYEADQPFIKLYQEQLRQMHGTDTAAYGSSRARDTYVSDPSAIDDTGRYRW